MLGDSLFKEKNMNNVVWLIVGILAIIVLLYIVIRILSGSPVF